jgi:PKD repeat protein
MLRQILAAKASASTPTFYPKCLALCPIAMKINSMSRILILCCLLLTAAAGQAQILLSENFNTSLPAGWVIVNGGSNAATWQRTTNGLSGQTLNGTQFMICNSDAAGNIPPVLLREELVSPAVNAGGASLLYLEFDHYFRHNGLTDSGHVDVWDGLAWQRIANYASTLGAFSAPAHQQYNITAFANPNLKVRFVYDDNTTWAWWWAVDNVQIIAPSPFDVGISAFVSPTQNGRRFTISALSATQAVQVGVRNFGSVATSNVPVFLQVDGGPVLGPTLLAGPLAPSQILSLTLANAANLAATGAHTLRAWTQLAGDANPANDTLRIQLRQFANDPPSFPHCIDFEPLPDTALQQSTIGLGALEDVDFSTNLVGAGRLRSYAGAGFAHTSTRALTLDRNPSGAPDAINYVTFTWNLAQYHAANDRLLADLWLIAHGDENQLNDSIWIRGCDNCTWLNVLNWHQLTGGLNGVYFQTPTIDLSARLASSGQDFSSSFQLRVGQEDNFPATSLTASDGLTIDDICLKRILPINAGVTALPSPLVQGACGDSLMPVIVTASNLGTVSLPNIPVQVIVSGAATATLNGTLAGPVAPGASVTATLGTLNTYGGGTYHIAAFTLVAADSAQSDDTLHVQAQVSPQLAAPLTVGDTFCIGDSGWVSVANAILDVDYTWYDSQTGGNLLGQGDSLQVGAQFAPHAYYVEPRSMTQGHLGPRDNQFGGGSDFASLAEGLVWDALVDVVIDSVRVYPADTGIVKLVLYNGAGTAIDSVGVLVTPSFAQQPIMIPVGLEVPQGLGYVLRGSGGTVPGLYRNNTGATYPYPLSGVAQITGAANGLAGFYYFFYDWVVRYSHCPGPRGVALTDTTTALPVAAFSAVANGLQVQFGNASVHGQAFYWDFGDGQSSVNIAPTHTYLTDGNYTVCLRVQGACGDDTICQTVTVHCLPIQAGFTAAATALTLQVTDTTSGAVGQHWDFGDGQSATGVSAQHTYLADGNYWVCLDTWNACGDTAQYCDSAVVCAPITAAIGFVANGLSFDFVDQGNGTAVAWAWDFGDGNVAIAAGPTHVYGVAGSYVVTLIVTNLCGARDTTTVNITVVGTRNAALENAHLFPNPMDGIAVLELPASWLGAPRIRIYDALGRSLSATTISIGNVGGRPQYQIQLQAAAAGYYWLDAEGENGHIVLPFLLQSR